jgi:hypothetical protein
VGTHRVEIQVVYLAKNGDPLWFSVGKGSDDLIPTAYTLWKKADLLPFLSTPEAVIPVLTGGADLMIPGGSWAILLRSPEPDISMQASCAPYTGTGTWPTCWD